MSKSLFGLKLLSISDSASESVSENFILNDEIIKKLNFFKKFLIFSI
jgi:hypothetical protein